MFKFFKNKFSANKRSRVVRILPHAAIAGKIISGKKRGKSFGAGKHIWIKILTWFLVVAFVGVTIHSLFFSPLLDINSVQISGTDKLGVASISEMIDAVLRGKYVGLLKKNNIILASKNNIEKVLMDRFKKIESVEITKNFPSELLIDIKERQSSLVFCSGEPCFVIDSGGQAYAQADFVSNELDEQSLSILRDLSQKSVAMKDVSIDVNLLQFVANIKNRLRTELGIKIKQEWSTPTVVSSDLRVETLNGWKIYFGEDVGTDKEIEMLKTILNNSIDKTKQADLEYIDLRLNNKVYYKFKTAPVVEENKDVPVVEAEDVKSKKKK